MKKLAGLSVLIAVLIAGAYGGYWYAHRSMPADAPAAGTSGKQVLYWYDPMYPQQKFDKPGKSPFMDMQLVPKYAGEEPQAGTVAISPQVVQNLGVRTARAEAGSIEQRLEAVGSVAYNERAVVQLQARAAGFVERLHARAPLDPVKKGAPLVEILYPEWAAAQEEYLVLRKSSSTEAQNFAEAARQRLLLLGMTEAQVAGVERDGRPRPRVTLASPINGVVAELGVREGMTVSPGSALFRLVDLSTVWVNAEVPETQAALLRPGTAVTARVAAYPNVEFEGRVGAILPEINTATRTVRARIELANPGLRLKPGMFANLEFSGPRRKDGVLVPTEAVIRTGSRDVVLLALGEGKFRAVDVEVGAEGAGRSEIREGLKAGDQIVLSGQFLVDSEASLSATLARLESRQSLHRSRGTVTNVDARAGLVELDHEAIPAMQWPRMTMGFSVANKQQLERLKPGDKVEFELRAQPDQDGSYVIERITK